MGQLLIHAACVSESASVYSKHQLLQNPLSDDTFFCSLLLLTARIFLCDNQDCLRDKINHVTLPKFMRKQIREQVLEECPRFVILRCSLEQLLEPSKPSHRIRG